MNTKTGKDAFKMKIVSVSSIHPLFIEKLFLTPKKRKELLPLSGDMGAAYKNGFVYLVKDCFIKQEDLDKKKRYITPSNNYGKGYYFEVLESIRLSDLKK